MFLSTSLICAESVAERPRVFQRDARAQFIGRGNLSVGQGQEINGASNLVAINANNPFNIGADGRLLGVLEQRSDQTQQPLAVSAGGQLFGLGGLQPEAKTVADFVTQFSQNRNRSNRPGVIDNAVAFNSGNPGVNRGQIKVDLSSIPHPDPAKNPPGSPEQLRYALATLNNLLNQLSNSSTLLRVKPENIRRDADGKAVVNLNLSRFFGREALDIFANSDPAAACTGRIRLQSLAFNTMFSKNYVRIKGIEGFNREQIFETLGVEPDKRRTLNNKIVIASRGNQDYPESGVTTSRLNRVSKFMNMRNNPGGTCYETDDFIDRSAPGSETNSRDVKKVGINYTHDASEVLCHQRNGFLLGMLFNAQGVLQTEAPANIALGGPSLAPVSAVSSAVSCMDCHSKGILGGGKRVHQDDGKFYNDNFDLIPGTDTVFSDQFGRRVNNRAFFTTNQVYRNRANRDTAIMFRAMAKSGSLIIDPKTNFPLPLVAMAVGKYDKRMTNAEMAAELGVAEPALTALLGGSTAGAERRNFDNAFCGLRSRLGGRNGFIAQNNNRLGASVQPTSAGVSGVRHNPNQAAGAAAAGATSDVRREAN